MGRKVAVLAVAAIAVGVGWIALRPNVTATPQDPKAVVCLTFDDGPDPDWTPKVLDILRDHHARATFFVVGDFVSSHPDILRQILADGHEVGFHGMRHQLMTRMSPADVITDFADFTNLLARVAPGTAVHAFRFPYGDSNDDLKALATHLGYTVAGWDVDTVDWHDRTKAADIAAAVAGAPTGSVVLLHDGVDATYRLGRAPDAHVKLDRAATIQGLDKGLEALRKRGIRAVTLEEAEEILGPRTVASYPYGR